MNHTTKETHNLSHIFAKGMALSTISFSLISYLEYKELCENINNSLYPTFIAGCFAYLSGVITANEIRLIFRIPQDYNKK